MARLPTVGSDSGNWGTLLNEYLEVEHNTDGSHKTDYLPKSGGTMTGNINVADNVVSQAEIKDYAETVVTANSGASYAVNLANGNVYNITLTNNCTITFTNPPATGKAGSVTLIIAQDGNGSRTITWPASVKWANGSVPTLSTSANAVDIIQFLTIDGGTTWRGFLAGTSFS